MKALAQETWVPSTFGSYSKNILLPGPTPVKAPPPEKLTTRSSDKQLVVFGGGDPEALEMAGAWEDTLDWEVTGCSSCFVIFNPNESCPWGH